jgi:putative resolvase
MRGIGRRGVCPGRSGLALSSNQATRLAALPDVKVRLGRLVENRQKGVDSLIVRDLIRLGVERAVATVYLVGGDEDIREGVAEAQGTGARVVLVGVGGVRPNQSLSLIGEVDERVVLGQRFWAPFLEPARTARAEAARLQPGMDTGIADVGVRLAAEWSATASRAQLREVLAHHPRVPASGVSRQSAACWFHAGVLPVPARQLATGTILVDVDEPGPIAVGVAGPIAVGVAVYARVSSADQRGDLDRQVACLVERATTAGLAPTSVVCEAGSGLSGHRSKLLGLLRDPTMGTMVVEHRDRLARFGVEYLEAALAATGRRLVVVEEAEVADDLVRDMVEVLTSFCARLCGRRSARRRAELALAAADKAA